MKHALDGLAVSTRIRSRARGRLAPAVSAVIFTMAAVVPAAASGTAIRSPFSLSINNSAYRTLYPFYAPRQTTTIILQQAPRPVPMIPGVQTVLGIRDKTAAQPASYPDPAAIDRHYQSLQRLINEQAGAGGPRIITIDGGAITSNAAGSTGARIIELR